MTGFAAHHTTSSGLGDQIAHWIAHSAIWHIVASLSLPALVIVAAAAVGWIAYSRRRLRPNRGPVTEPAGRRKNDVGSGTPDTTD